MHKHPDLIEIEPLFEMEDWDLKPIKRPSYSERTANERKRQLKIRAEVSEARKKEADETMLIIFITMGVCFALAWSVSGAF